MTTLSPSVRPTPVRSTRLLLAVLLAACTHRLTPPAAGTPVAGGSCAATFTPAYTIQGRNAVSPLVGQTVTTMGVVVGDYEGPAPALRGFYLQDAKGDGDTATSDAVFVFHGDSNSVSVGDVVRVTGNVSEFQEQTQITATTVERCGTGIVTPTALSLPLASTGALESLEGMLVRATQPLFVTETYQLARFGTVVVSSSARLTHPTNVVAPGAAANALQAQHARNRLIVDDGTNAQNPDPIVFARGGAPLSAANTLRGGDRLDALTGVLTQTGGGAAASGVAYRVRPVGALGGRASFVAANPRPATPPAVGGTLRVGAMNLLNFFNTFSGCTGGANGAPMDCRGASNAAEYERQAAKTVAAIAALNADVLGVNEIENDGYGPESAIADLVNRLNAKLGAGTYRYLDVDAATGQRNASGTDAIKVGLLYKPAAVTLVGKTATLNTVAFVNGGDTLPRGRPPLAQTVQQPNGARVTVVVNHFKSKSGTCMTPDAGDGQGNCTAVRVAQAKALRDWLASDPTGVEDARILIIGDLNSYAMEDPVTVLRTAGYTNLLQRFLGDEAYSFAYDAQWGYLDHALASAALLPQVTGVAEWHINADEPAILDYNTEFKNAGQLTSLYAPDMFRVSDHDPVLVGLALVPMPPPASRRR